MCKMILNNRILLCTHTVQISPPHGGSSLTWQQQQLLQHQQQSNQTNRRSPRKQPANKEMSIEEEFPNLGNLAIEHDIYVGLCFTCVVSYLDSVYLCFLYYVCYFKLISYFPIILPIY